MVKAGGQEAFGEENTVENDVKKKVVPVFRNRTKVDQIVYDESNSSVTVPSGKTIKGEWFRRYAGGKKNSPFVLVDEKDNNGVAKNDKNKGATDTKSKK